MKLPNAERIEERLDGADRALSVALREIGRLARVVDEQSARIESLEGANVKRDSEPDPAPPPYRMAPATRGLVHGSGKVPANLKPPAKAAEVKRDSETEPDAEPDLYEYVSNRCDLHGEYRMRSYGLEFPCPWCKINKLADIIASQSEPDELPATQPPDAEPPYRMTRPTSRDARVIDGGKVWRPVFGPDGMWEADDDGDWVAWEVLTDPEPFQNCTLTADDPEPPVGSVVRTPTGIISTRWTPRWSEIGIPSRVPFGWADVSRASVTLLYRGEA